MVGLATGLGARYPRFNADSPSQVAGSYGGVAFMIVAVLFTILIIALVGWPSSALLWYRVTRMPFTIRSIVAISGCFGAAVAMSVALCLGGMRSGVRALHEMDR
jgi:hypothetical protein